MTGAFLYAMGGGVCSEEDYPYHAKDEDCKLCHHAAVRPRNYEEVESEDGLTLKKAVSLAPVSVAIEADSPVFQHYKSGVIDDESCGASLNHGVLAVGYTEDYWIVKNSWGEDWDGGHWDDQDWNDWDEGNTGPDENRRPVWPGDADDESWPTEEDWQNFFNSGSWGWENT